MEIKIKQAHCRVQVQVVNVMIGVWRVFKLAGNLTWTVDGLFAAVEGVTED